MNRITKKKGAQGGEASEAVSDAIKSKEIARKLGIPEKYVPSFIKALKNKRKEGERIKIEKRIEEAKDERDSLKTMPRAYSKHFPSKRKTSEEKAEI